MSDDTFRSDKGRTYHRSGEKQAQRTLYNDRVYDSKLEAIWARFFDLAGMEVTPQPVGVPGIYYRPDFLLHKHNAWVEIKYSRPMPAEYYLVQQLIGHTQQPLLWLMTMWDYARRRPVQKVGRIYNVDGTMQPLYLKDAGGIDFTLCEDATGEPLKRIVHDAVFYGGFTRVNAEPQMPSRFVPNKRRIQKHGRRTTEGR